MAANPQHLVRQLVRRLPRQTLVVSAVIPDAKEDAELVTEDSVEVRL